MRTQITSLPALACFRAAAEYQNFSRAADSLNLSHGAVSRAVRLIEDDLAVSLFTRRNRAVFLTNEGRQLARAVSQGLGDIEAALRSIRVDREAAPVTVSCEPTLMMRWLIPRMPSLHRLRPEVDVRLVAGGGPVALGEGIDIAIRRDDFLVPDAYSSEPMFAEWIGPVCRPDLQKQFFNDGFLCPNAPLLHSRTRPSAWETWAKLTGATITDPRRLEFEHFYFSLQAAVAGLGVAIGPWHLVSDDLRTGILSAPAGFQEDGSQYLLLASDTKNVSHSRAQFCDWIKDISANEVAPE